MGVFKNLNKDLYVLPSFSLRIVRDSQFKY